MTFGPNAALLESWTLSLHGKSPGTRQLYLRVAGWFEAWLIDNERPTGGAGDLLAVTRQDAEAWFGVQRAAGLAAATLRSRWIALRNLYGWLLDEEEIEASPMARVRVAKANPEPIRVLDIADLRALLKACEGREFFDRRDMALIRLLASTGMRLAELTDLRVGDLDLAKRLAYVVHGKGDKARWVRFDAATAACLDRYKRARARHPHADLQMAMAGSARPVHAQGRSAHAQAPGRAGRHRPRPCAPATPHLRPSLPRKRWRRGRPATPRGVGIRRGDASLRLGPRRRPCPRRLRPRRPDGRLVTFSPSPSWPKIRWGPHLAAGSLVGHRNVDGTTTVRREGGAGAWVLRSVEDDLPERRRSNEPSRVIGPRYDFVCGYGPASFAEAHRELVRRARNAVVDPKGGVLKVRCGVGFGHGRPCGALLGQVLSTSAGPVWRPLTADCGADPATCWPGALPMVLVAEPEQWNHWCTTFYATCVAHGSWCLASQALADRSRRVPPRTVRDHYERRAVVAPHQQGPLVTDPRYWTAADVDSAVEALRMIVGGAWPPNGMTGVERSEREARAGVLAAALAGPADQRAP